MKVDIKMVSSRLKQARTVLSYDLKEVSDLTGIKVDELNAIENAERAPTGDEILVLASLYDCDYRSFIDEAIQPSVQETDILFRRFGDSFSPSDRRQVQEFLFL